MALTETRLDKIIGIGSGVGSRPAAGQTGARWIDTTGPTETYDNGSAWVTLISGAAGGVTKIAEQILAATATSIVFNSLGSYHYLELMWQARIGTTSGAIALQINADTAANYANSFATTTGTNFYNQTGLSAARVGIVAGTDSGATTAGSGKIRIYNPTGTAFQKQWNYEAARNDVSGIFTEDGTGTWLNAAAITSLTLIPPSGSFVVNSIFTLYGYS